MEHETLDMEHVTLNIGQCKNGEWMAATTWKMKSFPLGTASVALLLPWYCEYSYWQDDPSKMALIYFFSDNVEEKTLSVRSESL